MTTTRRRSPAASTSCTSGGSSCSPTPACPSELLPEDWPGRAAAELFQSEATRLAPGADRFVARCLDDVLTSVLTDCGACPMHPCFST